MLHQTKSSFLPSMRIYPYIEDAIDVLADREGLSKAETIHRLLHRYLVDELGEDAVNKLIDHHEVTASYKASRLSRRYDPLWKQAEVNKAAGDFRGTTEEIYEALKDGREGQLWIGKTA